MHEISTFRIEEITYAAIIWLVAFAAAFCRTVRDGEYRDFWHAFSIGATSGVFSFGIVAFLLDSDPSHSTRGWYYVGVSALIGLLAKEQDKYGRMFLNSAFTAAKLFFQKSTDDKE